MANYQILSFDLSAAQTTTNWKRILGTRAWSARSIHGTVTSGDVITVQMTNENLVPERSTMETPVSTANYAVFAVSTTATPFNTIYQGNFQWARVVKTGTNGVARVLVDC